MTSQIGSVTDTIIQLNPVINEVASVKLINSKCSLFTDSFSLKNVVVRAISGYNKQECCLCFCEGDSLRIFNKLNKDSNFEFNLYESKFEKLNVLITNDNFVKVKNDIYITIFYIEGN